MTIPTGTLRFTRTYDFSCIARWGGRPHGRGLSHHLTEVDKNKIGLAGHSRHAKQALLAAAFDERIGALILSSGNTGESDPWRYTTDMFVNESIEIITSVFPHWFHPRLRFFAGREDKLPVDQNMLAALIAPRGLMMYSGYGESEGNPFGYEQAYRSVRRVYRLLGHEDKTLAQSPGWGASNRSRGRGTVHGFPGFGVWPQPASAV